MNNFIAKVNSFMQGRNGMDKLGRAMSVASVVLVAAGFIAGFFNSWVETGLCLAAVAVIVLTVLRALSKNIADRFAENQKYMKIENAVTGWFKLTSKKLKERKTSSFKKCPHCKTVIRLPRRKGKHTARCPVCGDTFKVTIHFGGEQDKKSRKKAD